MVTYINTEETGFNIYKLFIRYRRGGGGGDNLDHLKITLLENDVIPLFYLEGQKDLANV